MYISDIPSNSTGCFELISTMILSAFFMNDGEFPTALVGIILPSSVIAIASTIATSTFCKTP